MGKSVLVVDNSKDTLDSLSRLLPQNHIVDSVDIANTGRKGLAKITKKLYDVVITNAQCPDMEGFVFLNLAKELNEPQYPIVISDEKDVSTLQKALAHGCFHYLSKPFTLLQIDDLFYRMGRTFPTQFEPNVYAFVGPKCVGKSESIGWAEKYIPCFTKIAKYSSRKLADRDKVSKDTRHISQMPPGDLVQDNIWWESYGNTNCILVSEVRHELGKGNDVGIAMAQYQGVESLYNHFPYAHVFAIDADPELIRTIKSKRKDDPIALDDILSVRKTFRRYFAGKMLRNNTFFDVVARSSAMIHSFRLGQHP